MNVTSVLVYTLLMLSPDGNVKSRNFDSYGDCIQAKQQITQLAQQSHIDAPAMKCESHQVTRPVDRDRHEGRP